MMSPHKCTSEPLCLKVCDRMHAGEDTWFCIHGTHFVKVHRLPGITMGVNMSEDSRFLIEDTKRDTKQTKTIMVNTPEEVQKVCVERLATCPYLMATGIVKRSQPAQR